MRFKSVLGLALVATFAVPLFAASPASPSFVGEWTAAAEVEGAPGGKIFETVKVVKTDGGYAITAKAVVPDPNGGPEAGPGTDIVLNGDNFTYKRTLSSPGGSLVITYTGVVSGDTFTGTADLGFAKFGYNGVRVKTGK
jgi:hypothetical protein